MELVASDTLSSALSGGEGRSGTMYDDGSVWWGNPGLFKSLIKGFGTSATCNHTREQSQRGLFHLTRAAKQEKAGISSSRRTFCRFARLCSPPLRSRFPITACERATSSCRTDSFSVCSSDKVEPDIANFCGGSAGSPEDNLLALVRTKPKARNAHVVSGTRHSSVAIS